MNKLAIAENNIMSASAANQVANYANLTDAQRSELSKLSDEITKASVLISELDRRIASLRDDIKRNPDQRVTSIKENKKTRKNLISIREDLTASYSGTLRVLLADVKGNELLDKFSNINR